MTNSNPEDPQEGWKFVVRAMTNAYGQRVNVGVPAIASALVVAATLGQVTTLPPWEVGSMLTLVVIGNQRLARRRGRKPPPSIPGAAA